MPIIVDRVLGDMINACSCLPHHVDVVKIEEEMLLHLARTMLIDVLRRRICLPFLNFSLARGFPQRAFRHTLRSRKIEEFERSVSIWKRQHSCLCDFLLFETFLREFSEVDWIARSSHSAMSRSPDHPPHARET